MRFLSVLVCKDEFLLLLNKRETFFSPWCLSLTVYSKECQPVCFCEKNVSTNCSIHKTDMCLDFRPFSGNFTLEVTPKEPENGSLQCRCGGLGKSPLERRCKNRRGDAVRTLWVTL